MALFYLNGHIILILNMLTTDNTLSLVQKIDVSFAATHVNDAIIKADVADNKNLSCYCATARNAIINGADYVVIGRPIRNATDPIGTIKKLQDEIAEGLASR